MPVQSFTLDEIMPEILAGSIRYVSDTYDESNGLGGMAKEALPQLDPKIRVMGKAVKRYVAGDIPESSEAPPIKDTKFTDEMFTAPEYGKGFSIALNDLIQNQSYMNNFKSIQFPRNRIASLNSSLQGGATECINMIKRAENKQVKDILESGVVQLNNYTDIDFARDNDNSVIITTANRKWTIANAATMRPYQDMEAWTEQVADRGNSGDAEMIVIMSRTAYKAYVNCDDYKDDSNQRRNYKVERVVGVSSAMNVNIPKGAVYRESVLKNAVSIIHIFTYNQTFTNDSGNPEQWITNDKVHVIATDNVFERQPVELMTFDTFAKSKLITAALRRMPTMRGWLVTPEWNKMTTRALVWGIYRKFLTLMLTPNKTLSATVNS